MPVLIARHAERVDYAVRNAEGRSWQASAQRPWDTPITDAGVLQANALGRAIARHSAALGLPPLTRIFCSPLLRCVQTAAAALDALGPELRICVEPALRETAGEDWYRSWAVEGADGTWGGPESCRAGVAPASLRPEAKLPSDGAAHDWLCADTALLRERLASAEAGTPPSAAGRLVDEYRPFSFSEPMGAHCWGDFESEQMQVARLGRFFDHIAALYPDETILLLSHGGPSASLFRHSQRGVAPAGGWKVCKYCGLYALQRRSAEGEEWAALLEAEDGHLAEVPEAGHSSGSSAAEQMLQESAAAEMSPKPAAAKFTCATCGEGFPSRNQLFKHLERTGHGVEGSSKPSTAAPAPTLVLENEAFDEYYRRQRICSEDAWQAAYVRFQQPLPIAVRISRSSPAGGFCAALLAQHIDMEPVSWCEDAFIVRLRTKRFGDSGSKKSPTGAVLLAAAQECGAVQRQELVSCLPPLLLDAQPSHVIADLCSAPGSKTLQLLDALYVDSEPAAVPKGIIVANEVERSRLLTMCQRARRLPRAPLLALCADARYFPGMRRRAGPHSAKAGWKQKYDRVLSDVPCSGVR